MTFSSNQAIGSLNGTAATATLNQTGALTIEGGGTYAGSIQGPASLISTGGTLTLNGTTIYSGNTTISGGVLALNTPSLASQNITVASGGTLTASASTALSSTVNLNTSGTMTLNAAAQTIATLNGAGGSLTLNGTTLTVTGGGTYGGTISGPNTGALDVTGGALILTSTNNSGFSGPVNVTGSGTTLRVNGANGFSALGTANVTVGSGATLIGATGDAFGYTAGAGTSPLNVNINGGTVTNLGTASYRVTVPNLTFTGGTLTSAVGNNGDSSGQYSLQGTALYGAFTLTTNPASATAVINAPTISLGSNAMFNVAAGSVTGGATPGVDLLISSNVGTYIGPGSNPANLLTVTKTGNGVMEFKGVNTYNGATTVNQGTLILGVANSINTTPQVILGGGKLVTSGFNQFSSSVTTLALSNSSQLDLGLGGQQGGGAVRFWRQQWIVG